MGRSNSIDVVSLHDEKILLHEFVWHCPAILGVVLVAISTAEDNSFAVDEIYAIFDLDLPEADVLAYMAVTTRQYQLIEIWLFG